MSFSRRQALALMGSAALLPIAPAQAAVSRKYSAEITHNDIHDLEWETEKAYKRLKYHSDDPYMIAAFRRAYQVAYDFHTHMHTEFEGDHAKTIEALKPVTEEWNRFMDICCDSKYLDEFQHLDGYYYNLELGVTLAYD